VDTRGRGVRRVRAVDGLLVGLVGVLVVLGRLLVVELGQPELGVRGPARGVGRPRAEHAATQQRGAQNCSNQAAPCPIHLASWSTRRKSSSRALNSWLRRFVSLVTACVF